MRLIDPIELKRSIAVSNMVHDGKTLEQIIDEQPSVEPKTGRWIIHKDWLDEGFCGYECPKCGRCYDYAMNFCGFCGEKMGVEHDEVGG